MQSTGVLQFHVAHIISFDSCEFDEHDKIPLMVIFAQARDPEDFENGNGNPTGSGT